MNVTLVPAACGLATFEVNDAADIFGAAAVYVSVIVDVRTLLAPSAAVTVIVLLPFESVSAWLQFAVLFPAAAPPDAVTPLTFTLVTPLPPAPLSVAVPLSVMLADGTAWPGVWLVMARDGAAASGAVTEYDRSAYASHPFAVEPLLRA